LISKLKNIRLNPWQNLIVSFLLLITLGAFLLEMPWILRNENLSFIDSLFISTSAVCVTGLTTINISDFNIFGELTLLILMQLGAIGIMTLSTTFILAIKGNINLKQKINFIKTQSNNSLHDVNHVLRFILRITFISEFFGAILLSIGFYLQGFSILGAIHYGIFHAISAFCNAGFSPFDNSLIGMNNLIKYTIILLIIIGGIGYYVIYELYNKFKTKKKLSLHSKIVLISTVSLIIIGTVFIYFLGSNNISITDSLFQSVTARTAGFNTVKLKDLHYLSLFFIVFLMFIGASPGSTGGGIKTTTFFIVFISIINILKGETTIKVFKRQISNSMILKSFAVLSSYFAIIFIGTLLLLYHTSYGFFNTMFEVTSAMGTVGLSVGVTSELENYGKLIIILIMFIGRIGPASIAMITFSKKNQIKLKIKYPEEAIY